MLWGRVNLLLCWKLLSVSLVGVAIGAKPPVIFTYLNDPAYSSYPLGETWQDDSVATCASKCRVLYDACFSFIFNNVTRTCTPGFVLASVATLPQTSLTAGDMFYYVDYCDSKEGFRLITYGGIVECLFTSEEKLDYLSARAVCGAKGTILFVAPTQPRMDLFRYLAENVTKSITWLGLNDMADEGNFYWEDGMPLSPGFTTALNRNQAFDNSPTTPGGEDCCETGRHGNFFKINDQDCNTENRFICQQFPAGPA